MGIERLDVWHRTQPGELPFRELPSGGHCALDRGFQGAVARKMRPQLAISHRADGRHVLGQIATLVERSHLVQEARGHHALEALRERRVQAGTIRRDHRDTDEVPLQGRMCSRLQCGDRLTGRRVHLERALDALRVVGMNTRGGRGVDHRPGACAWRPSRPGRHRHRAPRGSRGCRAAAWPYRRSMPAGRASCHPPATAHARVLRCPRWRAAASRTNWPAE